MLKYCGIYQSIKAFHRKKAQTNLTSLCTQPSNSLYLKNQSATLEKSMTEIKGKREKYMDLRPILKRMYPGHKITQVNVVFDFLSAYHTNLIRKLTDVGLTEGPNILRKCQEWVISQNCEIVKSCTTDKPNAPLRTFAPIATAQPHSARKFTWHVMHRASALSTKMNNDREDGHCYSFAWI